MRLSRLFTALLALLMARPLLGFQGAEPATPRPDPAASKLPPGVVALPPAARVRPSNPQVSPVPPWVASPNTHTDPLAFDSVLKEYVAKPGESLASFTFSLTNVSASEVIISDVRTSCGCTVANLPSRPWRLAAGTNGQFGVTVDLRGKFGIINKSVFVNASMVPVVASLPSASDGGSALAVPGPGANSATNLGIVPPLYSWTKPLTVRVTLPQRPATAGALDDRARNMQLAMADRQAVFKNDCAKCHAEPAAGKTGLALYQAACAICHDSHNRATMVPDLHTLKHPTDREHWIKWTTFGKPGSLMPAFAASEGGPLSDEQIDSLADYLDKVISQPAKAVSSKAPPAFPPLPVAPPPK